MFSVCRRILISANICMNEWLILAEVDSIQLPSKPSGLQNPANPIKAATYSIVIVRKWVYQSQRMYMYVSKEWTNYKITLYMLTIWLFMEHVSWFRIVMDFTYNIDDKTTTLFKTHITFPRYFLVCFATVFIQLR